MQNLYLTYLKPLIDKILAILVLTITLPLFLLILLILVFVNNGNPFFFQKRPGKNGTLFWIIKFKTMNDRMGSNGKYLPETERITKFGSYLRKYSMDELPQILNVLKGEMSWVGPRPLLVEYLPLYSQSQLKRHEVLPGITGWAQIKGWNSISWESKFKFDIWYVEHVSLWLDFKILIKTLFLVVFPTRKKRDKPNFEKFTGDQK